MGQLKQRAIELLDDPSDLALCQLIALGCDCNLVPVSMMLAMAASYLLCGISVVPQIPGAKSPLVKWKPYQTVLPSIHQVIEWWSRWPDAGIAVVLGPASNLFVVDVDGTPAHNALMELVGKVPETPTVRSGSGKTDRYHVWFRHPDGQTNSKATPVHPKLEFKGLGGIVIAPPSVHESGRCYEWVPGLSIYEIDRQPTPEPIRRALKKHFGKRRVAKAVPPGTQNVCAGSFRASQHLILSDSTLGFLRGEFANRNQWNDRIFRAACDLAGCGYSVEIATEMILAVQPWSQQDEISARRTIESAFSRQRQPGTDS